MEKVKKTTKLYNYKTIDDIVIQNNIPVPKKRNKYPFHKMNIGDSFYVPYLNSSTDKAIRSSARYFEANHQPTWYFVVKIIKETNIVRVWRIK